MLLSFERRALEDVTCVAPSFPADTQFFLVKDDKTNVPLHVLGVSTGTNRGTNAHVDGVSILCLSTKPPVHGPFEKPGLIPACHNVALFRELTKKEARELAGANPSAHLAVELLEFVTVERGRAIFRLAGRKVTYYAAV